MMKLFDTLCSCGCFHLFANQHVGFIKEFKHWFLVLNWEQGFLGRSILILKAHKVDESELNREEILEKHEIYCLWRNAVTVAFGAEKINQAQLGNEEETHKGHLHWHFIPRYRKRIMFDGVEFPHDTPETQKQNYSRVAVRGVTPREMRLAIKKEMLKYL